MLGQAVNFTQSLIHSFTQSAILFGRSSAVEGTKDSDMNAALTLRDPQTCPDGK